MQKPSEAKLGVIAEADFFTPTEDQVRSGQVKLGPVWSGKIKRVISRQAMSVLSRSGHVKSLLVMPD